MIANILLVFLIAIVGLLMYALCSNPKLAQIGWALFCIGAFWTVYAVLGQRIQL